MKRMPAIGLPDLLCQWIVSVAQLSVLLDSRRRWCGECMVRRPIASRIFGVLDWSAQMYPACLWSEPLAMMESARRWSTKWVELG